MHASSLQNMQRCYEKYLGRSPRAHRNRVRVLDVGGANINGSYADIFSDPRFEYVGADMSPGDGVDLVLEDPYRIPLMSGSVDVVISGQAFEHAEFFWRLFEEMARVVHADGLIFLIVPSAGPIHRFPVDCYRFYPDAMSALARYAGIRLIDCWMDDKGPWNDLVGVFSHRVEVDPSRQPMPPLPQSRYAAAHAVAPLFNSSVPDDPEHNVVKGEVPYLDVLRHIHERLVPSIYFEIGVRRGASLKCASCPAIAVDPEPDLAEPLAPDHRLYRETSDHFFEEHATEVFSQRGPDLVFIDGMHLFEFVLRDFIHVERVASPTTLVVIDDVFPNHPIQAERRRSTRVWTGDVWKLHDTLDKCRPDLVLLPLDTEPSGLLLVAGLDPANRTLAEQYNPLVGQSMGRTLSATDGRFQRQGALSPGHPRVDALLAILRAARESEILRGGHAIFRRMLRGLWACTSE